MRSAFGWLCALGFCFVAFTSHAVGRSETDSKAIPSDLLYEYRPFPKEENAIECWRRASAVAVSAADTTRAAMGYAWLAGEKSDEDQRAAVRDWLKKNREAFRWMDESLKRSKAQWPARKPEDLQPEIIALSSLVRGRLVQADDLADQGEFRLASDSLKGSLKLAQAAVTADGAVLIHYLVGSSMRTVVQGGILRFAQRREVPVALIEDLLNDLKPLEDETNTYSRVLRAEFSLYAYPGVDIKKVADDWSKPVGEQVIEFLYPEELHRPFRILMDPGLVALHPKPYDQQVAIETAARYYRIYLTNVLCGWSNRSDVLEKERERTKAKLLEDIEDLMDLLEDEPVPLSRRGVAIGRELYSRIENPVGRIMACRLEAFSGNDRRVYQNRTEREAVRALLGITIFERRKHQLPQSLKQLVEEGILPGVPMDFFASAPLKYSRERHLLWSVGVNGVNDDASDDGLSRWSSDDAVWKIPETN